MTAYESFLNLNPRHSWLMRQTNKKMHFEECGMDTEDLEDVKLDICDQVNLLVERREQGRLQDARAVTCPPFRARAPAHAHPRTHARTRTRTRTRAHHAHAPAPHPHPNPHPHANAPARSSSLWSAASSS